MTASGVWILGLLTNLILILSTRNPIYLFIILLGLIFSSYHLQYKNKNSSWLIQNLRFLLTMVFLSSMINALFSHTGKTTLLSLPKNWLLIGGNITLESMVYGAISGMIISALYLLFNNLNQALSIKQTIRLIPRAFYPLAMIVTIALTFFPSIQQRAREIKEAQMIRGNAMNKVADWLPVLIPLLVTSFEKAVLLSESMTARGFHTGAQSKNPKLLILGLISALFAVFSGWILSLYRYPTWVTTLLYIIGGILISSILIFSGRDLRITHFHKEIWHPSDVILSIFLTVSLVVLLLFIINDSLSSLTYSPYPSLSVPHFQLLDLLYSLFSLLPILFKHHD
jgi:energy-coupling factor transport system permease protein